MTSTCSAGYPALCSALGGLWPSSAWERAMGVGWGAEVGRKTGTSPDFKPWHKTTQQVWGFCLSTKELVITPRCPFPFYQNQVPPPTSQSQRGATPRQDSTKTPRMARRSRAQTLDRFCHSSIACASVSFSVKWGW